MKVSLQTVIPKSGIFQISRNQNHVNGVIKYKLKEELCLQIFVFWTPVRVALYKDEKD